MPSIAKQRRVNRSKILVKKSNRFGGNSKIKPFNPLCGKLKNNNNLLAKALSIQKQENQLLFSEKVQLTSQLQALKLACNKRDMVLANINNNAKEMLTMLVTMTNHVTNTIMCCQEFSHKGDSNLQTNTQSVPRRDSTRRLSAKSPARGVVKPMVSGHAITKPTINLRRINLQRINNLIDLSVIEEQSPERINNSTINSSIVHTAAFASTNRIGYEGERRRRLPERIPVEYVEADDEEGVILGREETSLSERNSGRHSGNHLRERSGSTITNPIQSPSVALCDVSKLLQNSQSINVRMLQNFQRHETSNELSNTSLDSSQRDDSELKSSFNGTPEKPKKSRKNFSKKIPSLPNRKKSPTQESNRKKMNESNSQSETKDPMEGPSWLLDSSEIDSSFNDPETERAPQVLKQKQIDKKLNPPDYETEVEKNLDDSMEFTECINTRARPLGNPETVSIPYQNNVNDEIHDKTVENTRLSANYSSDSSSDSNDTNHRFNNLVVNRSSEFVTDRRGNFAQDDDDDEDTIMLQLSRPRQAMAFNINDFDLPVLNSPIIAPVELDDSASEVTRTLQKIPQNIEPPNLFDSINVRVSNHDSLQLPNIDDAPKAKEKERLAKKKRFKNIRFYDSESSESDWVPENRKKTSNSEESKTLKDPSSAKVVLEKLTDTRIKVTSKNSDQNSLEKSPNPDTTNQRASDFDSIERTDDSINSTSSTNGTYRPRRQKAPVNLKEPNLTKKLRRKV